MKKIILLIETSREFGRQIIIGVARYSRLNGPWSFYKEPTDLRSSIPHLTSWKPDGMIMRDTLITKELLKINIPKIFAVHSSSHPQSVPVILTDSRSIGKMASGHLIEKGFKNFAFCGYDAYDWSNGRKMFFCHFNREAGFHTHLYSTPKNIKNYDWEKEQQHVSAWLNKLPKPIGILACNDDRGQHLLQACKFCGFKVPEDVAVIGVDNDPMICELEDPPLTSIELNAESAGFEAAKLLDELMNGAKMEGQQIIIIPNRIIQRRSSDILAVNDTDLSNAIQFIKNNAKNKIRVEDVVNSTSLGRRTLEKKFKETIHRSIYDEIQNVRIELISKLLSETNLPISEITSLFNFTDVEHISRFFKKEKGIGLREFRKLHKPK